jgi:aryl-alcohol dehydrogenase-like predicted oxidoreductase
VATSFILQKPAVAGVIIGARLGISEHRQDNSRVFDVRLDSEDNSMINSVTQKSKDIFEIIGDCGDEYR